MHLIDHLLQFILHSDEHLRAFVAEHGALTYALLGLIVFAETGLVVMPFLPGDSLLFAAGALAGAGQLDVRVLGIVIFVAAFCGDNLNYALGRHFGPRILKGEDRRWLNRKNLDKTHAFFERHGGKAVVIARFVPIVRTFAPFVAGIGRMDYRNFVGFSILGTFLWVGTFVTTGYLFGNIPVVKHNFKYVVIAIVFVSMLPLVIEFIRAKKHTGPEAAAKSKSAADTNERTAA